MLKDRLHEVLIDQAQTMNPITYKELANRLGLSPPQTILRVTQALEILMAEDVAAGRPLLAALCISRLHQRLPAQGFFEAAKALGIFSGDPESPEARAFHVRELQHALTFYRRK